MAANEATWKFVSEQWSSNVVQVMSDYIAIPNQSPIFDAEWATNGNKFYELFSLDSRLAPLRCRGSGFRLSALLLLVVVRPPFVLSFVLPWRLYKYLQNVYTVTLPEAVETSVNFPPPLQTARDRAYFPII